MSVTVPPLNVNVLCVLLWRREALRNVVVVGQLLGWQGRMNQNSLFAAFFVDYQDLNHYCHLQFLFHLDLPHLESNIWQKFIYNLQLCKLKQISRDYMLNKFAFKINVCCLMSNFISEQNPNKKGVMKTLLRCQITFETSLLLMI